MRLQAGVATLALALGTVLAGAPLAAQADATGCTPTIRVLPTVPGPDPSSSSVQGLSLRDDIAVGESQGLPVYWVGDVLHRVPLPGGYVQGAVLAVNRFGLMVGYVTEGDRNGPSRPFRYWPGNPAVSLYPGSGRAVDVNDAGHAVGWAYGPDGLVLDEYGPGTRLRRTLAFPDGYQPNVDSDHAGTGINNAGFVVASAQTFPEGGGTATQSFIWTSTGAQPQALLPRPVRIPGPPPPPPPDFGDPDYRSFVVATIDNKNRMVGQVTGVGRTGSAAWSSRVTPAVGVPFDPQREAGDPPDDEPGQYEIDPALVALSDRTGLAAGTARRWVDRRGGTPNRAAPDLAVVWDGTGHVHGLPRLAPQTASYAYAAQDDGRVGGWSAAPYPVPVVWTCAAGH